MVYFSKKQATSGSATTTGNNTFTGTNTFNNPIISNKGFYTTDENMTVVKMDRQQQKNLNFDFKQPTGGFKNYCDVSFRFTENDTAFTNLLKFEFRPDTGNNQQNNQCVITSDLANFSFNKPITFKDNIELKNPTNNNGAILTNFEYNSQNLTSLKFTKNPSKALLILEVNNDTETASISSPTTSNRLEIKNLKNPTDNNDAANKAYVDSRTKTYYWTGNVANNTTQNLETISWDKHIIGAVVFRKRSDNQWFCINNNMTQQLYRDNGTGQFKLYGSNATGTPNFSDEYRVYITYIN